MDIKTFAQVYECQHDIKHLNDYQFYRSVINFMESNNLDMVHLLELIYHINKI